MMIACIARTAAAKLAWLGRVQFERRRQPKCLRGGLVTIEQQKRRFLGTPSSKTGMRIKEDKL
jgi:Asp-tRNA(Asn)/Glu-tRNA(Gln) amidotransferase B subunit